MAYGRARRKDVVADGGLDLLRQGARRGLRPIVRVNGYWLRLADGCQQQEKYSEIIHGCLVIKGRPCGRRPGQASVVQGKHCGYEIGVRRSVPF